MKLGKKSRLNSIVCAFILVVGLICSTLLAGVTNIVFAKDEFENPIKNYQLNQSSNSEFITTLNNWTKVTYNSYNADNYNSGAIKWSSIQNAADESDEELWDDYKLIEAPGEVIVGDEDYNSYLMINAYSEAGRLGYKTSQSFSLDANSYYSIEVTYKTIKASNEKGTSDSFASIYLKDLSNEDFEEEAKFENLTTYNSSLSSNVWATRTFFVATSPYASENLNLELWLGGENESQICKGSVFFSHIDVQRYTENSFNEAIKNVATNDTQSLIDLDSDYISLDSISNADFEEGTYYSIPGWTQTSEAMGSNDAILTATYSNFSHSAVSSINSNAAEDNAKGLFMYLDEAGSLSMQSSAFTLTKNRYYLLSVWANSNSGAANKPSIQLIKLDKDDKFVSNAGNALSVATTSANDDYRNGWVKYSIYIHTDNFADARLALSLNLTEGYVFFDEVELKQISSANYSKGSTASNATAVDLGQNASTGLVANSNFNSATYEGNTPSFPATPSSWTLNSHEEFEEYVAGVISTDAEEFNANASNYPGLSNPGNFNGLASNYVLAMGCNNTQNEIIYKSNIIDLTAGSNYLLTFMVKTQVKELGNNAVISFRIFNDNSTIYNMDNIISPDWNKYSLALNTGLVSDSFYVELKIANVDGYVFFDDINLDVMPETFVEGGNHTVVELDKHLADNIDNWKISNTSNGQNLIGTTSAGDDFDEVLSFYGISNPSYISSNNKDIIYIHNENEDSITLTARKSTDLTAGNYYIVSVYVRTQDILGNGAKFAIAHDGNNEEFTNIVSENGYSKYYFFVNAEKASTLDIMIGLGTEEELAMGTAFFDLLEIQNLGTDEELFNTTYEEITSHSDNTKMVSIAAEESSTDEPEADEDHDHDHDHDHGSDSSSVWLAVSSSITALALIIALVGFAIRKIKGKKHTKTKVTNNYDRRKTLDKDMDKRERIELRKIMIEDLKKNLHEEQDKFNEYKENIDKQIEELNNKVVAEIVPIREEMQKLDKEQDAVEQEHNAKIAIDKRSTTPEEDKAFNAKVKNLEKQQNALRIKIEKIEAECERKISKLQFNLDLKKMKQDEINDQIDSLKEEIADITNE